MRVVTIVISLLILAAALPAEEMRLSFILDESSDWYEACRVFKERVEEATGGELTVRIVTNAQLSGNDQQTELEMVMSGGLEATLESSILLANVDPAMNAFTAPWRFANHDEAEAFADGTEGQALLANLEPSGIIGLAWGVNGFRQLTNSVRPVTQPSDLAGMRVRVAGSGNFHEIFRALGAEPVTMNFGELVTNLQTGAVEAQENPLSVIHGRRLFEVQDYLTIWNYTYDPIALCVNANWFHGLSGEWQQIVRNAASEAMAAERVFSRNRETEMLDELGDLMEVVELTTSQMQVFRQVVQVQQTQQAVRAARVTVFTKRIIIFGAGALLLLLVLLLVVLNVLAAVRRATTRE